MGKPDLSASSPRSLAELLGGHWGQRRWKPEELAAILAHQMAAPVQFDLSAMDPGLATQLTTLCAAEGLLLRSFADLFGHPQPPLELLVLTKEFAKSLAGNPESPLPEEISRLLYFASIAVALVRCRQRITELDDRGLREGLTWAAGQPWVGASTVAVLQEATLRLGSNSRA